MIVLMGVYKHKLDGRKAKDFMCDAPQTPWWHHLDDDQMIFNFAQNVPHHDTWHNALASKLILFAMEIFDNPIGQSL